MVNCAVIDATCPLVTKVHLEALKYLRGRPHDYFDGWIKEIVDSGEAPEQTSWWTG